MTIMQGYPLRTFSGVQMDAEAPWAKVLQQQKENQAFRGTPFWERPETTLVGLVGTSRLGILTTGKGIESTFIIHHQIQDRNSSGFDCYTSWEEKIARQNYETVLTGSSCRSSSSPLAVHIPVCHDPMLSNCWDGLTTKGELGGLCQS